MDAPRTVLLVRLSHLGDVVQTLPLWHAVRARWPNARCAWAVQPEYAGLVRGLRGLERVVPFERRAGLAAWPRLARELAAFGGRDGIDLAIDAQGNAKSAAVLWLSRARRRVGLARADHRERIGTLAANEHAPPVPAGAHAIERVLGLARHLGCAVPTMRAPGAALDLDEHERAEGRAHATALGGPGSALVAHVGEPGDPRSWPLARAAAFARVAAARGRRVVLVSGTATRAAGETLARELAGEPRVAHWVGQSGLRELAAFLAAEAERGGAFVGGDSGPIHLAAACGLPCVVLAGPQDPSVTGPWPLERHAAVGARAALACRPCRARRCALAEGPRCTAEIDERDVLERALALADSTAAARHASA